MSHDGNAGSNDFLYRINDLHTPFQFQSISVRNLHYFDRIGHRFVFGSLVSAKRQIHHNKRAFHPTDHRLSMINHLIKGDRKCGHISCHDIRSGVTYQYNIDACAIYNLRCRVIIGGKHRNFLASLLHFHQTVGSYFACIARNISCHIYFNL